MALPKLALLASPTDEAQAALAALTARYGTHTPEDADVIVSLGGDGFMLSVLRQNLGRPVYGMNRGTVGFLMNDYAEDDLPAGQEHFLALNAELTQQWPVITEKKDAPPDAADWDGKPDKLQYLER